MELSTSAPPAPAPIPAPRRRACVECTAAKIKCTPHSEMICERCTRLKKQCVYQVLPQKKRIQKNSRRVEALEHKLDDLLAQLATPSRTDISTSKSRAGPPTPHSRDGQRPVIQPASPPRSVDTDGKATSTSLSETDDIVDRGLLTMRDACVLVADFKNSYLAHFPFAGLRPEETADWLRSESPFLFLCIIGATSHTHQIQQRAVAREITRQLSTRLVLGGERCMDLLRGLLVHAAWYQHVAQHGHGQILMLTQLCLTLVHDLGLDGVRTLSMEEVRAVLGAYWLSICVARSIRKPIGMRHSQHLEDCTKQIAATPELPEDSLIQPHILLQMHASRLIDHLGHSPVTGYAPKGSTAVHFLAFSLLRELEQTKASAVGTVIDSGALLSMEIHYLQCWIWEIALRDEFWDSPSVDAAVPAKSTRSIMLWHLVSANKQFLHSFSAIPDTEMPRLSFINFARLCSVLVNQAKAAWLLLESIRGLDGMPFTPSQKVEAQMIIDEVKYPDVISTLLQKFVVITHVPYMNGWDNHTLVQLCSKLRAYALYYSKETLRIIGPSGITSTGSGRTVRVNDEPLTSFANSQGYLDVNVGVSDAALGDAAVNADEPFDQLLWDSIINDFNSVY